MPLGRPSRGAEGGILDDEFEFLTVGDQISLEGLAEEAADAFATGVAVVERPVVDVHTDEAVGEIAAHVACVLEGVLDGFGAVIEAVLDASGEDAGDLASGIRGEAFMNDIAAEGEGQALILFSPPDAEIGAAMEAFLVEGELAFVDDQSDVGPVFPDGTEDFVEGHDEVIEFGGGLAEPELEGEEGAGHAAGHGDTGAGDFVAAEGAFGDQHGSVAVAHAGSAGEQGVLVTDVGVGVNADGGDVQFAARGPLVEGLDILENVFEPQPFGVEAFFRQAEEHERIVRIGRVAQGQRALSQSIGGRRRRRHGVEASGFALRLSAWQ